VSRAKKGSREPADGCPGSRSGRHPHAQRTELRFTDGAIDDLMVLQKKSRQALAWAIKKFVLIERNPEAGAPLGGGLHGYRKLIVGDRDWRVIWRVTHEETGDVIIDIGEIWAVGARKDAEVYAEMSRRVAAAPRGANTKALEEVLALLKAALEKRRPTAAAVDPKVTPAPPWLVDDLVALAGYTRDEALTLTESQALSAWASFRSRSSD
jgi:mRNA interferase RelE/StbE